MNKIFIILLSALSLSVLAQNLPTDETDRAKIARQLTRSIPMELGKIEGAMPQINILIKKGEKAQAKAMLEETLQQIAKIEADQNTLALLDETADDEILMTTEVAEAKRYLTNKANQLRYTAIYITCAANLFGEDYATFCEEINSALTEFDISFVDDVGSAEWLVSVTAKAREHTQQEMNGMTTYYAYSDAELSIVKTATGKHVCQKRVSEKGGHFHGYNKAAQEAYKYLALRIGSTIKEQISK